MSANTPMIAKGSAKSVCIVTETWKGEVNGVAMTLGRLADGLQKRGHKVRVIRPRQHQEKDPPCREEEEVVPGIALPWYKELRLGLPSASLLKKLWLRRKPDIIYVATEGPLGLAAILTAKGLGVPVISGFHTNFHAYCGHYGLKWVQDLMLSYLRWFHNRTDCTLVPSPDQLALLRRKGFTNANLFGRGVDHTLFSPGRRCVKLRESWGVSSSDQVVLHVGRLASEKNLRLGIHAWRAMQQKNPKLRFVIVGDGPMAGELRRDCPEAVFCGTLAGEELARAYASADIFLFPSETETFGNVTVEAMASGLAVIAYNYAAAGIFIRNGISGALATPGNPEEYIEAALSLVHAPERVRAFGEKARATIVPHGWSQVLDRFEKVTGRILDEQVVKQNPGWPERWLITVGARATIG